MFIQCLSFWLVPLAPPRHAETMRTAKKSWLPPGLGFRISIAQRTGGHFAELEPRFRCEAEKSKPYCGYFMIFPLDTSMRKPETKRAYLWNINGYISTNAENKTCGIPYELSIGQKRGAKRRHSAGSTALAINGVPRLETMYGLFCLAAMSPIVWT